MGINRQPLARTIGALAIGGLVLAGCGEMPSEENVNAGDEVVGTADAGVTGEEMELASPPAGGSSAGTPEVGAIETEGTVVTLKDGKLAESPIEGTVGSPMVITITGDGKEHTFEIPEVVEQMTIAAEGETNVEFLVPEEPGTYEVLIDGAKGGEFEAQDAAGNAGM